MAGISTFAYILESKTPLALTVSKCKMRQLNVKNTTDLFYLYHGAVYMRALLAYNLPSTKPNSSKKTNDYIDCSALFETARQYASVKFSLTGNFFTDGQSEVCSIHDQYFNLKLCCLSRVLQKIIYPNTELNRSEFLHDKLVENLENSISSLWEDCNWHGERLSLFGECENLVFIRFKKSRKSTPTTVKTPQNLRLNEQKQQFWPCVLNFVTFFCRPLQNIKVKWPNSGLCWERDNTTANFSFSFLNLSATPTNLITG